MGTAGFDSGDSFSASGNTSAILFNREGFSIGLAGTVTMDQLVVDCGPVGSSPVGVGDEVVLLAETDVEDDLLMLFERPDQPDRADGHPAD